MHIVALAWLYVTILMAATEPSFVQGALTFVFYGVAPLALFLYLFGRRRRPSVAPDQRPDEPDRADAKPDQ